MSGLNEKYVISAVDNFDQSRLLAVIAEFAPTTGLYAPVVRDLTLKLVNKMAVDARVTDIRWMAYMLATACHETKHHVAYPKLNPTTNLPMPKLDKSGKPMIDPKTKQPVMQTQKLAVVFDPIQENIRGVKTKYIPHVKVERLANGGVIVTEQDGESVTIPANGLFNLQRAYANRGSVFGAKAKDTYANAGGSELQYFGRGFVQLTWWFNYVIAGFKIGVGFELLLEPDNAKDYEIAYKTMVYGMVDGRVYGTGLPLRHYFNDNQTDYVAARAMINSTDKAQEIANLAQGFEALLLKARPTKSP